MGGKPLRSLIKESADAQFSKLEGLLQSDLPESEKLKIHHALGYNYEKLRNRPKAVGHYARVASLSYALADSACLPSCAALRAYEQQGTGDKMVHATCQGLSN